MKNANFIRKIKYLLLSIVVVFISVYFISQKENLDLDEVYTYGLANNSFQLDIEDFHNYTGNELLLKYAAVNNNKFDIKNVFFNQKMDTHPPLYYLLVNFISSIFNKSFSMWYGLSLNIFFLVIVFWQIRYLFTLFIKNEFYSTILTLISFFTYGFMNEICFTRMYMMLTVMSLSFIILIINKLNSIENNKTGTYTFKDDSKFLLKFFLICVLGILTQYHFILIATFFSIVLLIGLVRNKNYKLIIATFISGILSIIVSILIFPGMLYHFFGEHSVHALTSGNNIKVGEKFIELFATLINAFFGFYKNTLAFGLYIYIIILIIGIVLNIILKKQIKRPPYIFFCFLICIIYYYIIISLTTEFTFQRYLYNIYPFIIILLLSPIYYLYNNINTKLSFISIMIIIILSISSRFYSAPTSLNIGDEYFRNAYLIPNKSVKTLFLYRTVDNLGRENTMGTTSKWKLPRPLYLFRDMENITFIDISYDYGRLKITESENATGFDDIILVIYTTENDNQVIGEVMKKNNVKYADKVYFTTYNHIYRLHN